MDSGGRNGLRPLFLVHPSCVDGTVGVHGDDRGKTSARIVDPTHVHSVSHGDAGRAILMEQTFFFPTVHLNHAHPASRYQQVQGWKTQIQGRQPQIQDWQTTSLGWTTQVHERETEIRTAAKSYTLRPGSHTHRPRPHTLRPGSHTRRRGSYALRPGSDALSSAHPCAQHHRSHGISCDTHTITPYTTTPCTCRLFCVPVPRGRKQRRRVVHGQ